MKYEVTSKTRAWITDTRGHVVLAAGTIIDVSQVGSRFGGFFEELQSGSLIKGTLEDGTLIETRKTFTKELS